MDTQRCRTRLSALWLPLFVLVALIAGSCSSTEQDGAPSARDRISYEDFRSAQSEFVLEEVGPGGEALGLAYTALGNPEDRAVVLVHGVPSSSWMYRYVMEALADEEVYLIAVDNLGYGSSAKPQMTEEEAAAFYAPSRQGERLGQLLAGLGVESPIFVVHDVGGPIVWELLSENPGFASGLVVLNTIGAPGGFAPPAAMDNPLVQTGMRLMGFERDETIRNIVCAMVVDREEFDTAVQLEGYYQPFREGSSLPYFSFLTNLDLVRDRLDDYGALIEGLDIPAAILWGTEDDNLLVDPSVAWFVEALEVPETRTFVVDEAKHLVSEEEPEAITNLILAVAAE